MKTSRIALVAVAGVVVLGGLVVVLVTRLGGSASSEGNELSQAQIDAAASRGRAFLDEAGNYGLTPEVFDDPAAAQATKRTPSATYVSRADVTFTLSKEFFHPAAIYQVYAYKDEAGYYPYRVTTDVGDLEAADVGVGPTGDPMVAVTADVSSELSFYGRTQGFLDERDRPVQPQTFRINQTYTDTARVRLVLADGAWQVLEVDGLDRLRILAFQDDLGFHDDGVLGLPPPDAERRVPVRTTNERAQS